MAIRGISKKYAYYLNEKVWDWMNFVSFMLWSTREDDITETKWKTMLRGENNQSYLNVVVILLYIMYGKCMYVYTYICTLIVFLNMYVYV